MTPNRRQFLQSAAAGALAAGCRSRSAGVASGEGRVFIAPAADYRVDLVDVISRGLREFPEFRVAGKTILVKPNLVETSNTDRPVNTHPSVVVSTAEALRRAGAREVLVGDGPGHRRDIELVLEQSGLGEALREARLRFVDLNHDAVVPVTNLGRLTTLSSLYLPRTVVGVDAVVSVAKMKTHHWAGVTLAMKNCFGLMPGIVYGWPKNILHWEGIEESIVDIVQTARPSFGIIDAVVGMEGDGPIMGAARPVGALLMGDQLASLDATAARIMGLDPLRILYVRDLAQRGFGPAEAVSIRQRGERVDRFACRFAVLPQFEYLLA